RKDFAAFGDEVATPQRTQGLGYQPHNIRQDYTGYEKDTESGLEFAQARYYNPSHGRFTSVDPLTASATIRNPQTFNRYAYALNSPYKFTDPLGLIPSSTGACGAWCPGGDSGSFGSRSGYQDVSANFLAEPETITVNLNIVYDASQFNAQQAVEALKPQIQDLADTYGQIKIEFNITFTAGTVNTERTRITSGAIEGSINVFFFKDSKSLYSYSKTDTGSRQIFLSQVNGDLLPIRALSHEIGHVFGFTGQVTSTAVRIIGDLGNNPISNIADNLYSVLVINSSLNYLRAGKAKYGTDWVDDYRTAIETDVGARVIPNSVYSRAKNGTLASTRPRVPTTLDFFRDAARRIAAQKNF
ncbi:MAG: RHS repeat-associated core domain-containing protein, partial [Hydrococcus sp. C42_A2020_068]|nr:RHS repeat-associated core domain-containing protein [Hydrococcus sp. C42_A2020_068]